MYVYAYKYNNNNTFINNTKGNKMAIYKNISKRM